jgi:3-methyladenine DNA glycosylase AlkD
MNKLYQELLNELKKHAGQGTKTQSEKEKSYDGTSKFCYVISVPVKRKIIKQFIKNHPRLTFSEFLELLNRLYQGDSHDEFTLGSKLLESFPKLRKQLSPEILGSWLNRAEGWAEVDGICQSSFTAEEMLGNWLSWEKLLGKFVKEGNIHKRRASLVLLTGPVRNSSDRRLANLAFKNIDLLKKEKHILITKAISWLLRSLIKNYRQEVEEYLQKDENSLPKIAVRETRNKLLTGLKTPRRAS